jgi:PAS domain S-box-containing protein
MAGQQSRSTHPFLRQIVESGPVATFVLDERHVVTHWNRACAAVTGVPTAEVVGTRNQWRAFIRSRARCWPT